MGLLRSNGGSGARPEVVAARYLSPEVRRRLTDAGIGFVDSTGNIQLSLTEPGLFIKVSGAERDPSPRRRPSRTLAGAKAGRIVRALCKSPNSWGVRELADSTDTNAGYVSRLLRFLDREALVEREARRSVSVSDWQRLLRRWAVAAPLESRGTIERCIAPRGVTSVLDKLGTSKLAHAVSGSFSSSRIAPIAPARLLLLYVKDSETARSRLDMRPTDVGSNVFLIEPKDEHVFEEGQPDDKGVCWASVVQVAADLLTSPGRGPSEAEALMDWMQRNEKRWRTEPRGTL